MDVRDYLERIQALVDGGPTLDMLSYLHERHLMSVPFENLDIHLGVPIVLDQDAILDKLVRRRRGGFCYELNSSFAWLLSKLGFRVTILSAEVARPDGTFGIPFDHMTLRVDIERARWLADVGFGESFLRPITLSELGDGDYRLSHEGTQWHLHHRDERKYRFTLEPRRLKEFEPGCHYHQTSEASTFTRRVVTTRATREGRLTLTRDRRIEKRGEHVRETPVNDETEWRRALKEDFDIVLENVPCSNELS